MMAAIPSTQLTAQLVPAANDAASSVATADAGASAGFPFLLADLLTQQLGIGPDGKAVVDLQDFDIKDILSEDKSSGLMPDAGLIENLTPVQQALVTPPVVPVNANPVTTNGEEAELPAASGVSATIGRSPLGAADLAEKIMAGRQPVAGEQEIIADASGTESFTLPSGTLIEQPTRTQHGVTPTAPASTPVAGAIQQPVSSLGWGDVLGDRVMWMVGQQQQGAELRLNPPALGPLEVKLSMTDGQATLTFSTQHLPVKEALEAATPRLKEMFSESGINLGSVSVNVGTPSQQQQQAEAQHTPRHGSEWNGVAQAESEFSSMTPMGITELRRQGNGMVDYFA